MKIYPKTLSCLLALLAPGSYVAHAQNTRNDAPVASAASNQDQDGHRHFITKALRLGENLVDLSDIGADRAVHPQVRTFAKELSGAHTTANQELAALILRKGLRIEDRDTVAAREMKKKWNDKTGNEIDRDFLRATVDQHEDMIDLLEDGTDSKDHDIAAYSHRHLPSLKSHMARAKSLLESID